MKFRILSLLIFGTSVVITGFHSSCTEKVNLEMPRKDKKIVVQGYLNPNQPIRLELFYSKPYPPESEDSEYQTIDNAEVKIFHKDSLYCELNYNDSTPPIHNNPIYEARNTFPRAGKKYKLQIKVPGYKTIHAETLVPRKMKIKSVEHYMITREFEKLIHCDITFQDNPYFNNYYSFSTESINGRDGFYSEDPLFDGEYYLFHIPYKVFNDELINGKTYNLGIDLFRIHMDSMKIELYSITEDCYLHLESVNRQHNKDELPIENVDLNIPIAEYVQVYSNIENGLGIFSGINVSSQIVYLNYDKTKSTNKARKKEYPTSKRQTTTQTRNTKPETRNPKRETTE